MRLRGTLRLVMVTLALAPAMATAATHASLTDIENSVMCVSCHESLAVAQSPQAYEERGYIRQLIGRGLDKPQILRQLVAQYGPAVLGRPPAKGFNLTVYILPPALVLLGLAILAVTLPRWRRRTRAGPHPPSAPALSPPEAQRLEDELSRFGG